jgi:hypothetical protein
MSKRKYVERRECPWCGGWFGFYVPQGGDGSVIRLRAHGWMSKGLFNRKKARDGFKCQGSYEVLDAGGRRIER